jgi:putative Mn2+ efflux pump MntP
MGVIVGVSLIPHQVIAFHTVFFSNYSSILGGIALICVCVNNLLRNLGEGMDAVGEGKR